MSYITYAEAPRSRKIERADRVDAKQQPAKIVGYAFYEHRTPVITPRSQTLVLLTPLAVCASTFAVQQFAYQYYENVKKAHVISIFFYWIVWCYAWPLYILGWDVLTHILTFRRLDCNEPWAHEGPRQTSPVSVAASLNQPTGIDVPSDSSSKSNAAKPNMTKEYLCMIPPVIAWLLIFPEAVKIAFAFVTSTLKLNSSVPSFNQLDLLSESSFAVALQLLQTLLVSLIVSVVNPLGEELLWRGLFCSYFPHKPLLSVWYPAVTFGLFHFVSTPSTEPIAVVTVFVVFGVICGLLWNGVAEHRHSIGIPILSHVILDIPIILVGQLKELSGTGL